MEQLIEQLLSVLRGIVRWRWQVVTQLGVEVLDMEATNLFDLG